MASYAVHKLLQSLCRSPDLVARLNVEPGKLCGEFQLSKAETEAVLSRDPAALARVGVHPILQIHFMMATSAEFRQQMDTSSLLPKLR
jgi:hypothetical protein